MPLESVDEEKEAGLTSEEIAGDMGNDELEDWLGETPNN